MKLWLFVPKVSFLGVMLVQSGNKVKQHVASWHSCLLRTAFTVSAANSKQCSQGDFHQRGTVLSKDTMLYKQVIKEWTRKGSLLNLILWTRKNWLVTWGLEAALAAVTMALWSWRPKRKELAKKQDHSPGFQESKILLCSDASSPSPPFSGHTVV